MNLLEKVLFLEQEAADFGFQWETTAQIIEQIQSECMEISEHLQSKQSMNQSALQEEIGDLLHAVFSLCVYCQFSPQDTLKKTLEKFERRLQAVKTVAKEKELNNLQGQSFDELMHIWNLAKKRVG
ncbi:nucleotide pyrophosphohydrolase [Legionella santicrucis]|uniref:Nucleotide pyrophosphohydrolase n=1 Tax=Legionella santicrucis TaxID=45074 RepID=A0A0W0ZC46_9GAMM|nr:MazG nucleotide pyrophosphohydrolase domain-containing protein [Legionella santicrucis]KTD66374.1 nucleotide pyrophosphohydrolase [Legionella santicrucis]